MGSSSSHEDLLDFCLILNQIYIRISFVRAFGLSNSNRSRRRNHYDPSPPMITWMWIISQHLKWGFRVTERAIDLERSFTQREDFADFPCPIANNDNFSCLIDACMMQFKVGLEVMGSAFLILELSGFSHCQYLQKEYPPELGIPCAINSLRCEKFPIQSFHDFQ